MERGDIALPHAQDPEAGVVYSTFEVIDELSRPVPRETLSQSIVEILESHEESPPQGRFDLAYTARAGDFRGRRTVQVTWVAARPHPDSVAVHEPPPVARARSPTFEADPLPDYWD